MTEHWTERLSDYLDGELSAPEAERLETHLATCAECAGTLAGLRAVVTAASALPEAPPERDLWPEISARLRPRTATGPEPEVVPIATVPQPGRRRVALTVPQLAAAGIALILFSASGVWMALRGGGPAPVEPPVAAAPAAAGSVAFASWEAAVADLEAEFERRREVLDPATIQVVERNLAIIDQAIAESRQALEADPSSGFLNGYLAEAMRRKVDLLRQATRIQRAET